MTKKNTTITIAEIGITVALATVLHFIKVFSMPQGGDISLTMIPILLISFRRGVLPGIISGVLYGISALVFDGVIYHPMSVLLDYILAFGILGIAGFFKKSYVGILLGTTLAVFGRFLCSLISGAVIFASFAPEGQNPWIYSLIYQASYLLPELIISAVALILLFTASKKLFFKI